MYASQSVVTLWESGAYCVTADCKKMASFPESPIVTRSYNAILNIT